MKSMIWQRAVSLTLLMGGVVVVCGCMSYGALRHEKSLDRKMQAKVDQVEPEAEWAGERNESLVEFSDQIVLENEVVRVVVSPDVGRVVWFGFKGGENLLWINQKEKVSKAIEDGAYCDWGGGKIWPVYMELWKNYLNEADAGRPDGRYDGERWALVYRDKGKIAIQSGSNRKLNLTATREFVLSQNEPRLEIKTTLVRTKLSPMPAAVCSETQFKMPGQVYMQEYISLPHEFSRVDDMHWLVVKPQELAAHKGVMGEWAGLDFGDSVLVVFSRIDLNGCYPSLKTFEVSGDGDVCHLQINGAQEHLQPREQMEQVEVWELERKPGLLNSGDVKKWLIGRVGRLAN